MATCYNIGWQNIMLDNLVIDAVILGDTVYSISDISVISANSDLAIAINNLGLDDVKIIAYKSFETIDSYDGISLRYVNGWAYIFKILTSDLVSLRLRETNSGSFLYINGIEQSCSDVAGYTIIDPCYSETTTTTTILT